MTVRRLLVLVAVGVALMLVGGVVLALAPVTPAAFGWFAYAPLSEATFAPAPGVVLGVAHLWGAAVGAVGLIATSWTAGYLAGRRVGRHP